VAVGGNYSAIGRCYAADFGWLAPSSDTSQFVNLPANTGSMGGATPATFALSLFGCGVQPLPEPRDLGTGG
jgi:type IV pilus assembly protein PilQ